MTKKIIDISPLVSSNIAVWPGDTPLTRELLCDISAGANIDLSTMHSTVHVGAHADAPRHYHKQGRTMEAVDLSAYIGPCVVISVTGKKMIEVQDCHKAVQQKATRVLFRTLSFPDIKQFNQDFTAFTPEALDYLGQNGVVLVGIDTPSVDPFDSKTLPAHQMLYKHKIANVEGLILDHVADGAYEFIGMPLKLDGFDASPIRAVLRTI